MNQNSTPKSTTRRELVLSQKNKSFKILSKNAHSTSLKLLNIFNLVNNNNKLQMLTIILIFIKLYTKHISECSQSHSILFKINKPCINQNGVGSDEVYNFFEQFKTSTTIVPASHTKPYKDNESPQPQTKNKSIVTTLLNFAIKNRRIKYVVYNKKLDCQIFFQCPMLSPPLRSTVSSNLNGLYCTMFKPFIKYYSYKMKINTADKIANVDQYIFFCKLETSDTISFEHIINATKTYVTKTPYKKCTAKNTKIIERIENCKIPETTPVKTLRVGLFSTKKNKTMKKTKICEDTSTDPLIVITPGFNHDDSEIITFKTYVKSSPYYVPSNLTNFVYNFAKNNINTISILTDAFREQSNYILNGLMPNITYIFNEKIIVIDTYTDNPPDTDNYNSMIKAFDKDIVDNNVIQDNSTILTNITQLIKYILSQSIENSEDVENGEKYVYEDDEYEYDVEDEGKVDIGGEDLFKTIDLDLKKLMDIYFQCFIQREIYKQYYFNNNMGTKTLSIIQQTSPLQNDNLEHFEIPEIVICNIIISELLKHTNYSNYKCNINETAHRELKKRCLLENEIIFPFVTQRHHHPSHYK
jgi:hypothetical protein